MTVVRLWRVGAGTALIAWAVLWYGLLYGLPMLGRRCKLGLATGFGLDAEQVDMIRRLERRQSPYHPELVRVSLHEMYNEARVYYDIKPWRMRLVM
ncbi:MAG: hypothetical protein HY975_00535 [Candidatus Kerfeldbacteria bacterium]|nr:hypothetical protein [Candidatus Kerfeldbacteria bacterium]